MATKNSEQDFVKSNFELWRSYSQTYTDLVMDSLQETMSQGLAAREQLGQMMIETMKKAQELGIQEREAAIEMTESFNKQVREAGDQFRKAVSPEK